jgi:hypothetical protein
MIKADPVHSNAAAACIAIANMNAPLRRPLLANIAQGVLHRRALLAHAARLPLAIDADVQRNGIVKNRPLIGARGRRRDRQHSSSRQNSSHRRPNDTGAFLCRNSRQLASSAVNKRKAAAQKAPPLSFVDERMFS